MLEINTKEKNVGESLRLVRNRISAACTESDRDEQDVCLLAVSKTKPLSMIQAAINEGQRDFGENYLQDALEKISALPAIVSAEIAEMVQWHFVGAIQSNKTKLIAENFDWVHTVSSYKVARRLNDQRPTTLKPLNILIQINIDDEESKSGILPEQARALIESIRCMEQLHPRGLMAIPAKDQNSGLNAYRRLRLLLDELRQSLNLTQFDQLSMGMSADLALAIAEGSTIVRVGTDIFGARSV